MKNKKPSFYIWSAAALLTMIIIFVSSSLNAEDSGNISGAVTMRLFRVIDFEYFVRKAAHVAVYAIMGFCVTNALRHLISGRKLFFVSLAFSSFYAATDELHQLFVPGRAGEVQDWAIDTLGALAGIGAAFLFMLISRNRGRRT